MTNPTRSELVSPEWTRVGLSKKRKSWLSESTYKYLILAMTIAGFGFISIGKTTQLGNMLFRIGAEIHYSGTLPDDVAGVEWK